MIHSTTDTLPGREIVEIVGLVRGNSVRAAHAKSDFDAWMKNLVGGEIEEYTKVMAEAREQAFDRMSAQARGLGADAIVGVRFASSEITDGAAEVLCYGTAVKTVPVRKA